jgi:hypothetical protein
MALTLSLGQALSNPLEISANLGAVRLGMPDGWDPAPITFQISYEPKSVSRRANR